MGALLILDPAIQRQERGQCSNYVSKQHECSRNLDERNRSCRDRCVRPVGPLWQKDRFAYGIYGIPHDLIHRQTDMVDGDRGVVPMGESGCRLVA